MDVRLCSVLTGLGALCQSEREWGIKGWAPKPPLSFEKEKSGGSKEKDLTSAPKLTI